MLKKFLSLAIPFLAGVAVSSPIASGSHSHLASRIEMIEHTPRGARIQRITHLQKRLLFKGQSRDFLPEEARLIEETVWGLIWGPDEHGNYDMDTVMKIWGPLPWQDGKYLVEFAAFKNINTTRTEFKFDGETVYTDFWHQVSTAPKYHGSLVIA